MVEIAIPALISAAAGAAANKMMAPGTGAQEAEIARQREAQQIALSRQQGELQNQEAETDLAAGKVAKVPRGRRLLLAATGEAGLPKTLGG